MTTQGTTTDRGYGWPHQQERARWQQHMDLHGPTRCQSTACKRPEQLVDPADWHLGHTPDRTAYTGPEHPGCNTSEGASRGNRQRAVGRGRPSREW